MADIWFSKSPNWCTALDGIGTLRPFARASVIPMPTPAQLRTELEASTHFREYEIQASKGGSGRC